ncbi:MAG: NAD(+)/NADH kinase [Myxococcales bacterium]|nr:NAD(+)/NADH kinase [Myxococcota bacterium]MDW8282137.1 NAD(+)/NADH kinase [Myxococcales bacterium]
MSAVAFLLKRNEPQAAVLCQRLVQVVRARGLRELVVRDQAEPPEGVELVAEDRIPQDVRLMVVLGGDGTLLYAAGLVCSMGVPILGVNLGHLGFLSACSPDRAVEALQAALDGHLPIEERQRLLCRVHRGGPAQDGEAGLVESHEAVNDIVLNQPAKARLLELDAFIDGHWVATYQADGLIVSTPTGSTAYNLAAGGPLLLPETQSMVLTPICPHALTARPVVAPLSSNIEVRPGRSCERLLLTVDGQWEVRLQRGDTVRIGRASAPLRIFRAPERTFFDLLRTKLHWGVRE